MTKVFLSSLSLYLFSSFALALNSVPFEKFSVENDPANPEAWVLKIEGNRLGELQTIGGSPRLLNQKSMNTPTGAKIMVIEYEAGIAGTQTLTALNRFLVLYAESTTGPWQIALDAPKSLKRMRGARTLLKSERGVRWSKNYESLILGPFDEYPEQRFEWKDGILKSRSL